jgi:hypothetical protein
MATRTNDTVESSFCDNHTVEEIFVSCAQEGCVDFLARAFAEFGHF